MNKMFLKEFGYDEWTTTHGILVCPHGNKIEDDLREGHHKCGCVSPLHEQLGI